MGGVVPEAAARAHVRNILPVTKKALSDAHKALSQINLIAVTQGPGLIPSLIVGVEFAKALSLAKNIPVLPINHMAGHLYSPFVNSTPTNSPIVSLIVSGGHTLLVLMMDMGHYKIIGQTVDDAAGEAFDKVAKLLGLPYPGGPGISKLAAKAKHPVEFPRPMIHSKDYNFSFAGLKTAVLYYLRDHPLLTIRLAGGQVNYSLKTDISAGFQNAVTDVLVAKTMRAVKEFGAKSVALSGGVSANRQLRDELSAACAKLDVAFFTPRPGLSTDNAEMIGIAAAVALSLGAKPKPLAKIQANPNLLLKSN